MRLFRARPTPAILTFVFDATASRLTLLGFASRLEATFPSNRRAGESRGLKRGAMMECKVQNLANVVLIEVEGRIDHSTAPAFGSALLPQVEGCSGENKKLVLDLSKVTFMSSAGLRVLMIAAKGCRKQVGKIVLAALPPTIREIFKIGRFDMVLETFPTVREALAAISPAAAALYGDR